MKVGEERYVDTRSFTVLPGSSHGGHVMKVGEERYIDTRSFTVLPGYLRIVVHHILEIASISSCIALCFAIVVLLQI